MKTAIFPGSFNPWHEGHQRICSKALKIFNKIIIAVGTNPEKNTTDQKKLLKELKTVNIYGIKNGCIEIVQFDGLLVDYINQVNKNSNKIDAVIRGLRNGTDLEYEKTQMYWNQDLKIGIPTICFISDRDLVHISSSAIRAVNKFKKD